MRTLILSCSTGGGHNSCADAIKEVYDSVGDYCVITEALNFVNPNFKSLICSGHSFLYRRMPFTFSLLYNYLESSDKHMGNNTLIYAMLSKGVSKLAKYIQSGNYDSVICTHVFAALMLTEAIKRYKLVLSTAFVTTDYTCYPGVKHTRLDRYFIPDESLKALFACETITFDRIIPCGIPIKQELYYKQDKHYAKKKMGVQYNHKHLLIMGGSMGCGRMYKLTSYMQKYIPNDIDITVVCGTNKSLKRKLLKRFGESSVLHIKGYVNDMSLLYDSVDLCITKPGGLTTTELMNKCVPMILVNTVSGCEKYNLKYFLGKSCAKTAKGNKAIAYLAGRLLMNDIECERMKTAMFKHSGINSAMIIHSVMKGVYNETACY